MAYESHGSGLVLLVCLFVVYCIDFSGLRFFGTALFWVACCCVLVLARLFVCLFACVVPMLFSFCVLACDLLSGCCMGGIAGLVAFVCLCVCVCLFDWLGVLVSALSFKRD